jgi:hypothetical protein
LDAEFDAAKRAIKKIGEIGSLTVLAVIKPYKIGDLTFKIDTKRRRPLLIAEVAAIQRFRIIAELCRRPGLRGFLSSLAPRFHAIAPRVGKAYFKA